MHDEATKQNSGIELLFGDFSIDAKPSTTNLEQVDWNGELVSAVLEEVEEGLSQKGIEKNEVAYWMDERLVVGILRGRRVDEEAVVGGGGGGDAMQE
jgi:hypothetical protein